MSAPVQEVTRIRSSDRLPKRILGRTGLTVTVIGLGGGGDSRLGQARHDEGASVRLVQAALDRGVNVIDTAEAYGTEEVVGRALRGRPRDQIVLSTKKTTVSARPLEPGDATKSLEASLKRLGTDYVDVYHLHGVPSETYPDLRDRLVPELLRLKDQGKIRFLGITERFGADPGHRMLVQALADDLWDVIMVGFNVLNQSARDTVFSKAIERDVGVLVMFAVRRALSRPERLREVLRELAARGKIRLETAEAELETLVRSGSSRSLPDAAYRFCRDEPGVHVVLSGTGSLEHLADNVRSLSGPPLTSRERANLTALFDGVDDVSGH